MPSGPQRGKTCCGSGGRGAPGTDPRRPDSSLRIHPGGFPAFPSFLPFHLDKCYTG